MKKSFIHLLITLFSIVGTNAQTVTDVDGNVYNTIVLGTQEWMTSNLRTLHFSNGDLIPHNFSQSAWSNLNQSSGADYYNNDELANGVTYGVLYNWAAVSNMNNVCPTGWHVPTNNEWTTLINFAGGSATAGGPLKERDTVHWNYPNFNATNFTGFTAMPGGLRHNTGGYQFMNESGYWWTSTQGTANPSFAYNVKMSYADAVVLQYESNQRGGFSVRCLKNANSGMIELKSDLGISLHPNPANNEVTLVTSNPEIQGADIRLYSLSGTLVLNDFMSGSTQTLDLSNLPAGSYVVTVEHQAQIQHIKLVLVK
jgi:uncharacterized protein (TIGR02145 family)